MKELDPVEVEAISGGLSNLQNVGLGLAIGAFAFTVGAVVCAPITVVAGGMWIMAGGLGALSTAAFATPTADPRPKGSWR